MAERGRAELVGGSRARSTLVSLNGRQRARFSGRRPIRALAAAGLVALVTSPLVTAPLAFGATCIFEGGSVSVRAGDETVVVQQDGVAKTILVNGVDCSPAAPVAGTTDISISGGTRVAIDLFDTAGTTIDWGPTKWSLELGFSIPSDLVLDNGGGDGGIDVIAGATGIDLDADGTLDVTYSGTGVLSVIGGPGADTISGSGDATTGGPVPIEVDLSGGPGDDRLSGGLEDDLLDCGLGVDWVDFTTSPVAVTVDLSKSIANGQGSDTVTGCENVAGSAQDDTITGDGADNVVAPAAGNDTIDGADGTDTVTYADATATVVVDLPAGQVTGGSGTDALANVENAVGSDFDDRITGDGADNRLVGGAGPDTIVGGDGDDTLDGGSEIDRLVGGNGLDTCILEGVELSCEPSIGLDHTTIAPGGSLNLTGAGWYPENGAVDVQLVSADGTPLRQLATLTPDDAGTIQTPLSAPSDEGTYAVEACQPCADPSAERARQDLLVEPASDGASPSVTTASLTLSQTEAHPGDRIHVLGSGWDRKAGRVEIFLDPSASTRKPDATKLPRPNGDFDVPLDVPELAAGSYTVLTCQRCDGPGRVEETATLTIPGPSRRWVALALAAALAGVAGAGVALRRLRKPRLGPADRIAAHLRRDDPDVLVVEEPDGRPRHSVRLVPRPDPGVQRVSERSPT